MKDFFAQLNFTRVVILVSLVASAVLGFMVYNQKEKLAELNRQVDVKGPRLVNEIQLKSQRYDQLMRQADKEKFGGGQADPELYITNIAEEPNVAIGQVKISPTEKVGNGGVIDKKYRIAPDDSNRAYTRTAICNFLYRLEENSRLVKVTNLTLKPVKTQKPEEFGTERWTFDAEITSRQAKEDS